MAEKDEKAEPNNDDDELDALLDSALKDFAKKPSVTASSNSKPHGCERLSNECKKAKGSCAPDDMAPQLDGFGLSESDIEAAAAEFEKSMKEMLGEDEELLKQWNEFTEKAAEFEPEEAANEEDAQAFEAHLLKTMKNLAENAKEMSQPPEFDEHLFKAMSDMNIGCNEPDLNSLSIFPMMQGMMMNLLSKDVLYPALDDLRTKYPAWLEENKNSVKSGIYKNYTQQYKLVCEICSEYDKENEQDSDETKKKRFDKLMRLMQEMQRYGQPPHELVGDKAPPFGIEGNSADGFPPNKCPVM